MMTLSEAIDFIKSADWQGCRPGLERITDLMNRLENPQKELRYIHITGTNGKGSTAAMTAAILQSAGYKVGLFTSPHLRYYNERIKVNGIDISDDDLCAMAEIVKPTVEQMEQIPSEFERFTAMAFLYFKRQKCDIVVLEVGLGGQLDCTNVIPSPEVAVITNIGLEHTEYLGKTLKEIAGTKSGIIKPGADVVLYHQSQEVEDVVRNRCVSVGCRLCVTDSEQLQLLKFSLSGQLLNYRDRKELRLSLLGMYQNGNAAVALDTADALIARGWKIPETAVRRGLSAVQWPGRLEVMQTSPLVLVDGAHNPNGAAALVCSLREYLPGQKLIFVMGVMADKNYDEMLDIVAPLAEKFITVTPESHRSLPSDQLRSEIQNRLMLPVISAGNVGDGLTMALRECGPNQAICVFGSLYQVGEVRAYFRK